jgi:hypothetical protein
MLTLDGILNVASDLTLLLLAVGMNGVNSVTELKLAEGVTVSPSDVMLRLHKLPSS